MEIRYRLEKLGVRFYTQWHNRAMLILKGYIEEYGKVIDLRYLRKKIDKIIEKYRK